MTFPSDEKLMRIAELSEWLSVHKSTIYKWVEQEVRDWLKERPRGKHFEE
jgi:predicted DNA-binding transcriptional regulator AlpA